MAENEWPEVKIFCSHKCAVCNSLAAQEDTVSYPMAEDILICLQLSL